MDITEQNAAERLRLKDPDALAFVIDTYGAGICRLVERIVSGTAQPQDVEECVSDIFLTAWEKVGEFDPGKGTLRVWLHIIAKYKALDYRRKRGRGPVPEPLTEEPREPQSTEDRVISKARIEDIVRIVDTFDPVNRSLFYKRYFYYETMEEIARSEGITVKAAESRLGRMRQTLRRQLETGEEEFG
ncbi:sigma-70 family RNA polymerase sigma factor [Paenibacillus hemerocallicola]|uniref:Sigma-70 family RNA polymerase sigma factor n=1 Tax=Paenibacillus hemerocallicola TaxID=1172614 RepID=A0A5C4SWF7_9BACL|nr:sigma-70 family RNA polymerase sigma factor [Paenibacillus hemerocallicola]TNJ56720.1 sigma-70 family RNA polymerase sigma factor [Paenibacillus hemerocallicola]